MSPLQRLRFYLGAPRVPPTRRYVLSFLLLCDTSQAHGQRFWGFPATKDSLQLNLEMRNY